MNNGTMTQSFILSNLDLVGGLNERVSSTKIPTGAGVSTRFSRSLNNQPLPTRHRVTLTLNSIISTFKINIKSEQIQSFLARDCE